MLTAASIRTNRAMEQVLDNVTGAAGSLHHQKFIKRHLNHGDQTATISSSLSPHASDLESVITSETDLSDDEFVPHSDSISYFTSLSDDACPFKPSAGWSFGTGDLDQFHDHAGVDILLSPVEAGLSEPTIRSNDVSEQSIRSNDVSESSIRSSTMSGRPIRSNAVYQRQGHFAFDPNFASFWIHARHKGIKVNGQPLARLSKALLVGGARISIGPYQYIFEFKVSDEVRFQEQKRRYIARHYSVSDPHEFTALTPSVNDIQVQGWHMHGIVGSTPVTVIHAATNVKSGEVVAVKRLRVGGRDSDAEESDLDADEVDLYEHQLSNIKEHRYGSYTMQTHSVLRNQRLGNPVEEVYLLWKPLARGDFTNFQQQGRWHTQPDAVKRALFVTALLGLSACHDSGWIHRDLKPGNLGVVDFGNNPRAIILDFGHAVKQVPDGHQAEPGCWGTNGYQAPELVSTSHTPTYNEKVDVWSMGAVAYMLFCGGDIPWSQSQNMWDSQVTPIDSTLRIHFRCLDSLLAEPVDSIKNLIGKMLDDEPTTRPSVAKVLEHTALRADRERIDRYLDESNRAGEKRRSSRA